MTRKLNITIIVITFTYSSADGEAEVQQGWITCPADYAAKSPGWEKAQFWQALEPKLLQHHPTAPEDLMLTLPTLSWHHWPRAFNTQ